MIESLLCGLFGHVWEHKPNAVPEDRESYKCERCGKWTCDPASVGMPEVPEEDRV